MTAPDAPGVLPADAPIAEAPFAEPWHARAFALTVHLHARGAFTWSDWAAVLGSQLAADGDDYWAAWLRALEAMLAERAVADAAEIADLAERWRAAARATPHGTPIALAAAPD